MSHPSIAELLITEIIAQIALVALVNVRTRQAMAARRRKKSHAA